MNLLSHENYVTMLPIRDFLQGFLFFITHTYREGNQLADELANEAVDTQTNSVFFRAEDIPIHRRRAYIMDRSKLPNIRFFLMFSFCIQAEGLHIVFLFTISHCIQIRFYHM